MVNNGVGHGGDGYDNGGGSGNWYKAGRGVSKKNYKEKDGREKEKEEEEGKKR